MAGATALGLTERKTFCRLCNTHCGMIVSVDGDEQLRSIRPDPDDLLTSGFACYKGLQAVDSHQSEIRIRKPMKRLDDGSFVEIGLEQALDEIADKLRTIIDRDGPEAIGAYRGSGCGMNASACFLVDGLLHPLGSRKIFSAITIDQSAKVVAAERLGIWPAGTYPTYTSDVVLLIGANPLISLTILNPHNPMKHLKEELARGLKLLIIDPRRTETVRFAHAHVQPLPGEDASILAGMLRLILANGWEDKAFVARHAAFTEELRAAVEPFTPEHVAARANIGADDLIELTRTFAQAPRAVARTGTGGNMGAHSNLVEHLTGCLNVLCGSFMREGERIDNPGVLLPRTPKPAQVRAPTRSWEHGYKSRIGGYGLIYGEVPTGIMAEEILTPGPGRIRGFFCHGGNAAVIVPDQAKVVEAFRSLELLVTIDVHWNPTAELAHYVLPTVMQYERPDLPCWQAEFAFYNYTPFTRYTHAVARPPVDTEVAADDYIFWSLAKRLGVTMTSLGFAVDMTRPPVTDDFLRIAARHAPMPFEELQGLERGAIFDVEPQYVEPGQPGPDDRFALCPPDIQMEMEDLAREATVGRAPMLNGAMPTHRFSVRRHRDVWNSTQRGLKATRRRLPYNVANFHPDDLAALGARPGEVVRVTSAINAVDVVCEADETIRRGVMSMVHGFGVLPGKSDPFRDGASANLLISTRRDDIETINAMPRMTSFPIHVERAAGRSQRSEDSSARTPSPASSPQPAFAATDG